VGTLSSDNTASLYYAQELGLFGKYGLDVQITPMQSGPVVAAAVTGGALDIGVANCATIAVARTRGVPLKFIFPASVAGPGTLTDQIMVAKDSPIASASDMAGHTIGVNGLRDLQQLCAMAWVDKHGGDSKTVKFIEIPIPQMGPALEANRVDVALPVEPFVTVSSGIARSFGSVLDGIAPRYMVIGWLATDSWLAAHPDLALLFNRAMREAAVWGNAHRAESATIIARLYKLDPETVAKMNRATYGLDLDPAMMQPVVNGALKYGILTQPIAVDELIWKAPKT
jgi:NitT/TauT family transport system substrate-binding protein